MRTQYLNTRTHQSYSFDLKTSHSHLPYWMLGPDEMRNLLKVYCLRFGFPCIYIFTMTILKQKCIPVLKSTFSRVISWNHQKIFLSSLLMSLILTKHFSFFIIVISLNVTCSCHDIAEYTGTRVHSVMFLIFIKIKYFTF